MQQAGGDIPSSEGLKIESSEDSTVPKLLREGDHTTDIIFTVEERNLHFSKYVLTICSPVFQALLTSEYIQQHSEGIPLPGKKYSFVAFFLQQLHPVYSAVTPITDDMLLEVLALAKEYQVGHIRTKCEQYMGSQLQLHCYEKILKTDTVLIYLTACEQHSLNTHRQKLVELAAEKTTKELQASKCFGPVPAAALRDVFLARSQILELKTEQLEKDIAGKTYRLQDSEEILSRLRDQRQKNQQSLKNDIETAIKNLPSEARQSGRELQYVLNKIRNWSIF